jgi:Omega Transcriptional Repressor.
METTKNGAKKPDKDKRIRIDPELHKIVKLYAYMQGRTIKEVIEEAIREYLRNRGVDGV